MSAATRDRRATLYPYIGHNAGGFTTSTYGAARGSYWCRVSPLPGEEFILDAQSGIAETAVLEFGDEVPVAEHDLVVVDSVNWKAGPVTRRRGASAKVLRVERSTEQPTFATGQSTPAASDSYTEASHSDQAYDHPLDSSIDGGGATAVVTETTDLGGA